MRGIWNRCVRVTRTFVLIGAASVMCLGGLTPAVRSATAGPAEKTIDATVHNGYFQPFLVTANLGDSIVWKNVDSHTHQIAAAIAPPSLEGSRFPVSVEPNQTARATLTRAGIYDLYGADAATYDAKLGRVVAHKGEPPYPIPMEQILVVMGPAFTPAPKSGATVVAPADYFQPYVTVVQQGATITFHNADTDPHIAIATPGSPNRFPATPSIPGGKSAPVTFSAAGVYQYYCALHATYRAAYQRSAANHDADAYPTAMEGVVVVLPKP